MKKLIFLIVASIPQIISGQQDQQLFLMHYLGESNFLNPAIQSECKWFIGVPVLSSIHTAYSNSAFSYKQLIKQSDSSTYIADINGVTSQLGPRSIINAEVNTTLLALGYRHNQYYYAFSVIDKLNLPLTFPRQTALLAGKGNTQFEGRDASLRGSALYFTYYREYSLGISKTNFKGDFKGIKGKLLFGKLNLSTPNSTGSLYTDPNTFNLTFNGPVNVNMSAPVIVNSTNNRINSIEYDQNYSISQLLLNRKNWGIAFDLGFIKQYDKTTTISGSILDLGFIRWRSNLNNISTNGHFFYNGPLDDTINTATYVDYLLTSFQDSMRTTVSKNPYTTFLPVKFYLGATRGLIPKVQANVLFSGIFYKTKMVTAAAISADYNPLKNFHVVMSYSLMYRSYDNVGLGFSLGNAVQFYAVTDNIIGIIWPLSARDLNLRFGLNINLGCNQKFNPRSGGFSGSCPCYQQEEKNDQLKANWKKN